MRKSSSLRLLLSLLLGVMLLASFTSVPVWADGSSQGGTGDQVNPPDTSYSQPLSYSSDPIGDLSLMTAAYLYLVVL